MEDPDPFAGLNAAQREAVFHRGDEPLLVIAGAGTGKTTTIAHRIARLVIDGAPIRGASCYSRSRAAPRRR